MPSIICTCGIRLGFGAIPNPNEWLMISDDRFDDFRGNDLEELYKQMSSFLKCSDCGRLWVFWNGFDADPFCYAPE